MNGGVVKCPTVFSGCHWLSAYSNYRLLTIYLIIFSSSYLLYIYFFFEEDVDSAESVFAHEAESVEADEDVFR